MYRKREKEKERKRDFVVRQNSPEKGSSPGSALNYGSPSFLAAGNKLF